MRFLRRGSCSLFVLTLGLFPLTGCVLQLTDPKGRACDIEHPCSHQMQCVQGTCVDPTGTGGGEISGTGGGSATGVGNTGGGSATGGGNMGGGGGTGGSGGGNGGGQDDAGTCTPSGEQCDGLDNNCNGIVDDLPGCVYRLAGFSNGYIDGPAAQARFGNFTTLAFGPQGEVVVADQQNHALRAVWPDGGVTTLIGDGQCGSNDGTADTGARLCAPWYVTVGDDGALYITEACRLRKLQNGVLSTLAGNSCGYNDATGNMASFTGLRGLTALPNGDVLVADSENNRIRRVTPDGTTTTEVGALSGSNFGNNDGTREQVQLRNPVDVEALSDGTLLITEAGALPHRVRVVPKADAGVSSTLAGGALSSFANGTGAAAGLFFPTQTALDETGGALYLVERATSYARKMTLDGGVTTSFTSPRDVRVGTFANTSLTFPSGVAYRNNHLAVTSLPGTLLMGNFDAGTFSDYAGLPSTLYSADGPRGQNALAYAWTVVEAGDGSIVFNQIDTGMVRRLRTDGVVETLATRANGLVSPRTLALSRDKNAVYVVDIGNCRLFRIDVAAPHTLTTLAGSTCAPGSNMLANGPLGSALFSGPVSVAVGAKGDGGELIFVGEQRGLIRRIDMQDNVITQFAGTLDVMANPGANGPLGTGQLAAGYFGLAWDELRHGVWVGDLWTLRFVDVNGTLSSPLPPIATSETTFMVDGNALYLPYGAGLNRVDLTDGGVAPLVGAAPGWRDGHALTDPRVQALGFNSVYVTPTHLVLGELFGIRRMWR